MLYKFILKALLTTNKEESAIAKLPIQGANLYNIYKSNKNKDNNVLSDILTKEIDDYLLSKDKNKTMKKEILINGMMCEHCVNHVTKALSSLKEVEDVKVSLKDKNALISGDVSDEKIIDAITNAGYEVKEIKNV